MVVLLSGSFHISYTFLQPLPITFYDLCVSVLEKKVRTHLHCLKTVVVDIFPSTIYEAHSSLYFFFFFFLLFEFILKTIFKVCLTYRVWGSD